jgi:hypothetical protein
VQIERATGRNRKMTTSIFLTVYPHSGTAVSQY